MVIGISLLVLLPSYVAVGEHGRFGVVVGQARAQGCHGPALGHVFRRTRCRRLRLCGDRGRACAHTPGRFLHRGNGREGGVLHCSGAFYGAPHCCSGWVGRVHASHRALAGAHFQTGWAPSPTEARCPNGAWRASAVRASGPLFPAGGFAVARRADDAFMCQARPSGSLRTTRPWRNSRDAHEPAVVLI